MVELVKFLVESLVENKDEATVKEIDEGSAVIIEVHVAPDDMGKVIGKNGRIAKAIRTIVKSASLGSKKQYYVKII